MKRGLPRHTVTKRPRVTTSPSNKVTKGAAARSIGGLATRRRGRACPRGVPRGHATSGARGWLARPSWGGVRRAGRIPRSIYLSKRRSAVSTGGARFSVFGFRFSGKNRKERLNTEALRHGESTEKRGQVQGSGFSPENEFSVFSVQFSGTKTRASEKPGRNGGSRKHALNTRRDGRRGHPAGPGLSPVP